jgi:hypothetical protein
MPSVVASTFRASVAAQLTEEQAELMKPARGTGPEHRETHRALMLGDRAAREWAATAVAAGQVGAPNEFESLPRLAKPEDAYHSLQPAAERLRSGGASPAQRALGALLFELSEALSAIDKAARSLSWGKRTQRSTTSSASRSGRTPSALVSSDG